MLNKLKTLCGFLSAKIKENREISDDSILVIDDSEIDRKILENILSKNFSKIFLAKDGQSGLNLAINEKPDLIILDLIFHGSNMNGFNVLDELNDCVETQYIPVIILTQDNSPLKIFESSDRAQEYLIKIKSEGKPVEPKSFIKRVKGVLKEFENERGVK